MLNQLIDFLRHDLALPEPSIDVALRHSNHSTDSLPMVLWQYGLVSLNQLDMIFEWLETVGV
ncbi:MAG: DUF2949 domain-containing protein [Spirulinaceae cyanobacterium]